MVFAEVGRLGVLSIPEDEKNRERPTKTEDAIRYCVKLNIEVYNGNIYVEEYIKFLQEN